MVMPVAVMLSYLSMDLANGLMQNEGWDRKFMRDETAINARLSRFVPAGLRPPTPAGWPRRC